jgi:hypothetical protein
VDTFLGLVELVLYVLTILALSAAVTYGVVRISPAQSAKQSSDKGSEKDSDKG